MAYDGGNAFSRAGNTWDDDDHKMAPAVAQIGMSLRAYFAAKAMQGLLSAPSDSVSHDAGPNARASYQEAALHAVGFADALIFELEKE